MGQRLDYCLTLYIITLLIPRMPLGVTWRNRAAGRMAGVAPVNTNSNRCSVRSRAMHVINGRSSDGCLAFAST